MHGGPGQSRPESPSFEVQVPMPRIGQTLSSTPVALEHSLEGDDDDLRNMEDKAMAEGQRVALLSAGM